MGGGESVAPRSVLLFDRAILTALDRRCGFVLGGRGQGLASCLIGPSWVSGRRRLDGVQSRRDPGVMVCLEESFKRWPECGNSGGWGGGLGGEYGVPLSL